MNKQLLNTLVCPQCQQSLASEGPQLRCDVCQLAFPIVNDIPVLLINKALSTSKSES
jgi:uncharacterized protein YbaR (Trm112 family)